jgi:hypothetical protein
MLATKPRKTTPRVHRRPIPLKNVPADEPNPPVWPDNKVILVSEDLCEDPDFVANLQKLASDPYNPYSQNIIGSTRGTFTSYDHFSKKRVAVLFRPGNYQLDLEVGYYTQVLGLGRSPSDVVFTEAKGIYVPALDKDVTPNGTCLNTFWRSAENFKSQGEMQWAVSQAASIRRIEVAQDLILGDAEAYCSGGFVANIHVGGILNDVAQQQFFHRNVNINGGNEGGAWSTVFVNCNGAPEPALWSEDHGHPTKTVEYYPRRLEKPYISVVANQDGTYPPPAEQKFELRVPTLATDPEQTVGASFDGTNEEARDFSTVRVIGTDDPDLIQQALDQGKDVVLAAGIYTLANPLVMSTPNQVLLGIGMATIIAPPDGSPAIKVEEDTPGVRIAGITLEASKRNSSTEYEGQSCLLVWGTEGDAGDPDNPGGLFDVYCRVGGDVDLGPDEDVKTFRQLIHVDYMMRLLSGNIIADNLWLWRADHAKLMPGEEPNHPEVSDQYYQTKQSEFRVETGLDVKGDDVVMYGLAVEHANGHQTVWSGERGRVFFYQCELPYGVNQETFAAREYRGYLVSAGVMDHVVHAPGVYSNFRDHGTVVTSAMEGDSDDFFRNPFTVLLDNNFGILHIYNGKGPMTAEKGKSMWTFMTPPCP